jgi:predicted transcriptional regulator
MKLSEIRDILNADVISGKNLMDINIIGGGGADLMDDVLAAVAKGSVLLTGLTTEQVLRTARIAGVSAIIIVRGKKPDLKTIEAAESYGIPILLTRYSLFEACGKLYMDGL